MTIIEKALQFARDKHAGQLDDSGKLYIFHPVMVAQLLVQITQDENLVAAAYLHDTLEETNTTYAQLVEEFGEDIANLVLEVTKRKKNGRNVFPDLKTKRGILLKFADRLHNLSRMENWDSKRQEKYLDSSRFWKTK